MASRYYIFDQSDRPIAELDGSGNTVREYVWLDDKLISMLDVRSQWDLDLYYVHSNHLNQPIRMTDLQGDIVWDVDVEPFGQASVLTSGADLDLRLPGQWEQFETDLFQNHWRDYDPTLGRYLDPDPVGLSGGANVYGYAYSDPLHSVDPTGEFWQRFAFAGARLGGTYIGNQLGRQLGLALARRVYGKEEVSAALARIAAAEAAREAAELLKDHEKFCRPNVHFPTSFPLDDTKGVPQDEPNRCKKVRKRCMDRCTDIFADDSTLLPGSGSDMASRLRRCVRECMERNGCSDY